MAAVARGRPSSVWLLCSILQGCSKRFDAGEPLLRVLCKGPQHHLLDRRWDRGDLLKQRRRGNSELLAEYLISLKRRLATEPFIRHDRERVLIARRAGLTLDMLRSHVRRCASEIERLQRRGVVSGHRDAKVTEQHLVIAAQQHILRLDIAVDQFCAMGMLERSGNLPDIGDHEGKWKYTSARMRLAQRPFRRIVHHEERRCALDPEVEDAHYVQVLELCDGARLFQELLSILHAQGGTQHLDGSKQLEMEVFPQVDVGKPT